MPRPLRFPELYTRRGRKDLLFGDSSRWSVNEIARYLGLEYYHGRKTHFTLRIVREFVEELRRTTSDLLDVGAITGEPGDGNWSYPTSLAKNAAFIGIARTISQEYGPSLWGRDRREHLVWPRDLEGFTGLYWDREKDRDLIQFLVRCWLVRQTYLKKKHLKEKHRKQKRLQQIGSAIESCKVGRSTSTAKRMYRAGSDSDYDSDDEPLITKRPAVRRRKSCNPQPRYILDDEKSVDATREHDGNDSDAGGGSGYDSSFSDLLEQHSFSIDSVLPEDNVPRLLRDLEYLAKGQERQSTTAAARNASSLEGLATPSNSPGTAKSLPVSFAREDDSFAEDPDEERPSAQEIIFHLEEILVKMRAASARSSGEDCAQSSELSRSRSSAPSPEPIPQQADISTRKDTPSPAICPTQRAESQQTNMVQRAIASSAPDKALKIATPAQARMTSQADRSTQTDVSVQARWELCRGVWQLRWCF